MYTIQQFNYSIIKQKNSTISKVSYDNYEIKTKKQAIPFWDCPFVINKALHLPECGHQPSEDGAFLRLLLRG